MVRESHIIKLPLGATTWCGLLSCSVSPYKIEAPIDDDVETIHFKVDTGATVTVCKETLIDKRKFNSCGTINDLLAGGAS